jgi:hypothetical protein
VRRLAAGKRTSYSGYYEGLLLSLQMAKQENRKDGSWLAFYERTGTASWFTFYRRVLCDPADDYVDAPVVTKCEARFTKPSDERLYDR